MKWRVLPLLPLGATWWAVVQVPDEVAIDVVAPYFMPAEHTHRSREILGSGPWLRPEVKVVVESDSVRARATARDVTSTYLKFENYRKSWRACGFDDDDLADGGSDRFIDATVAWGDEDKIASFLQSHYDAGASHVAIQYL